MGTLQMRELATGNLVPAHRIGTDGADRPVYQHADGYEPTRHCVLDEDGNWVFYSASDLRAVDGGASDFADAIARAAERLGLDIGEDVHGSLISWVVEGLGGCASDDALDPEEWARCLADDLADRRAEEADYRRHFG